jgi:hypothetical protein
MGLEYGLCPVALENAQFFLDLFVASVLRAEKCLTVIDFQV